MRIYIFLILPLAFVLAGCPSSYDDAIRDIRQNNMDFPNLQPKHELGLGFNLSDLFVESHYTNLAFSSNKSISYATQYNEILFSIEEVSTSNLKISQLYDSSKSTLESVRDYAISKRASQYEYAKVSEPRELYSLTKKKGWLNLISQEGEYATPSFLIATIMYNGKYYIVQLATIKEYNDYFYNDFLDILKSIK